MILEAIVIISLLAVSFASVVFADSGTNLTVNVQVINISLSAGESATQTITVGSSGGVDVTVEVDGLSQTPQGATSLIPAQEDTSSFSARSFISLNQNSINVAAGGTQNITATINVPSGTSPGERYACIYLTSPTGQGGVGVVAGILIPVIIDTPGYTAVQTGNITNLSCLSPPSVSSAYSGYPIVFNTTFNNTGNCLITGAENTITVKNSSGKVEWSNEIAVPAPSLLPNTPRIIDAQDNVGLNEGNYSVESNITLSDGTVLDTKTINFTVVNSPAIPAAPELISPGNSMTLGPVIATLTPTFEWKASIEADYYTLTISRTPYSSANVVYISDQLTGTSYTLPTGLLFKGQSYCWQMTATNISGTSANSGVFYFQTPGTYSPPTVATNSASNITSTGATLNGTLSGLGSASSVNVNFVLGTSTNYGVMTAVQTLNATGAFSANITGLTPNTVYHFEANAGGLSTIYGNDMTFTTVQAPTTSTSTAITSTSTTMPTSMMTTSTTAVVATITSAPSTAVIANIGQYLWPGIDPSSLAGMSFNGVATPYLNATQQAGTEITLNGISGNGSIIVGKYISEPSGDVPFSDGTMKGGTGETPIQFIFLITQGYDHGTAQIVVHFTSSEISGFDPSSLFLAYYNGSQWVACENNEVSPGNSTITGDIPVSQLTAGTVIGLGGNQIGSANVVPFVPQSNNGTTNHGVSWSLVGIVVGLILVVGGVVWVVERNRRKSTAD